jgi:hypothetical protein
MFRFTQTLTDNASPTLCQECGFTKRADGRVQRPSRTALPRWIQRGIFGQSDARDYRFYHDLGGDRIEVGSLTYRLGGSYDFLL